MRKKIVNWPSMPFLRVLPPLIAGVLFPDIIPPAPMMFLSGSCLVIILAQPLLPISLRFRLRYFQSIAVLSLVFVLGTFVSARSDIRKYPNWFGLYSPAAIIATIDADPFKGPKGISMKLRVLCIHDDRGWLAAAGRMAATAKNGNYERGDTICIQGPPLPLRSSNPGYLLYLNRQNIFHSIRLNPGNSSLLGKCKEPGLLASLRKNLFSILDSLFPDKNEKAMAQALLTGYRGEMDPSLLTAYTNTGVVHVIAVSGMHLALIYAMVSLALKPLRKGRTRQIRIFLILALLWIFAMVCGASPSVVRSALMFSFILCADAFTKEQQPANTLAGSAFVLVCHSPLIIHDIGFQLSYAAVASLMLYSGPVGQLLQPSNRLLSYCWTTISTTLAAQVLTTPLALVHFGQFPLLFLLSNIIAVPLSGIILILLILDCILHPAGLSTWPTMLTSLLIRFMNDTITGLGSLEFATLRNIHIRWYDAVNIYIVILAFTLWRRSKK